MLQGQIAYSGASSNDSTRKLSRSSLTLVQDVIEALRSLSNALGGPYKKLDRALSMTKRRLLMLCQLACTPKSCLVRTLPGN